MNSNWSYSPETPNLGQNRRIFLPEWPCNLTYDLGKIIGHLFYGPSSCYFKLYASFHSHWWIQTGVTVRKRLIWVKFDDFESCVTLKFDLLPLKNKRAPLLCYFKLCASFRSHWWIQNWSYSPETPNLGQIRQFLDPCDLEIWRMTLKINKAPLLCYFKLCTSFRSHWWIQTWVTVRKRPIWVKFDYFFSHVTLKFDGWPWKTIGHLS